MQCLVKHDAFAIDFLATLYNFTFLCLTFLRTELYSKAVFYLFILCATEDAIEKLKVLSQ